MVAGADCQLAQANLPRIRERPAAVEDRALPGHWEGDLLFGSQNSQIATLVERRSRYAMLAKVDGKDTETVVNALIKHAQKRRPVESATVRRHREGPLLHVIDMERRGVRR